MLTIHLNVQLNHYNSLLGLCFGLFVMMQQLLQKTKIMVKLTARAAAWIDLENFDCVKLLLLSQT